MKAFEVFRVFHASSSQVEQLEAILKTTSGCAQSPGRTTLFVDFELEHKRTTDFGRFEEYCRQNNLRFWKLRRRSYSKSETEASEYFLMRDEDSRVDTSGTLYTTKTACPICGVGVTQLGPLVIDPRRLPKRKKVFCVSLRHSTEWVLAAEACELFRDFSGFRFGDVCTSTAPGKVLEYLRQIMFESSLPRMATITNFIDYDPPMEKKCACNRAGWNLRDEVIYQRAALKQAKDFNLTVERWYGGGIAGLKWAIVSQRVRQVMLKNRILSPGCFDPVHIIEQDPNAQYKFELPLDTPASHPKVNLTRQP